MDSDQGRTQRVLALVVAAGSGRRARTSASADLPKQYKNIAGLPMLARALSPIVAHQSVSGIAVVINPDDRDLYDRSMAAYAGCGKILEPVSGGETRQASVRAGLEALVRHQPDHVLVHDAARPFLGTATIDAVVAALSSDTAVVPASQATDTLLEADARLELSRTVDRSRIWHAQTPQGFHFLPLLVAHRQAESDGASEYTDDASLMAAAGYRVRIVASDQRNRKVTTAEDFDVSERLLAPTEMPDVRVGHGIDIHKFTAGDHVWLCGVKIPHDRGVEAHSDGDVALHALTDALLGAIADGDIGQHFRNTDPRWRGAASEHFLADAARRVRERSGHITHVDVTILAEAPKIGPYRDAMRLRLSEILALDLDRIGLKATTTETLGFAGRREGLAAMATATVVFARRP